jgi:hypothetical protein
VPPRKVYSRPRPSVPASPRSVADELPIRKDGWAVVKKDWQTVVKAARYATEVADRAAHEAAAAVLASADAANVVKETEEKVALAPPAESAAALRGLRAARMLAMEKAQVERQATERFREVINNAKATVDEMACKRTAGPSKMLAVVDAAVVNAKAKEWVEEKMSAASIKAEREAWRRGAAAVQPMA